METSKPSCFICGKRPVYSQKRCRHCYWTALETGEIKRVGRPVKERLLSKVRQDPSGCWLFEGHLNHGGYGLLADSQGRTRGAHRISYEIFIGPIPSGLHIDHLCRVRNCVQPAHLEAVPQRTNTLRGVSFSAENALKTHCIHGHEFTPENTYYRRPTHRQCRTCMKVWQNAYYRRKRFRT